MLTIGEGTTGARIYLEGASYDNQMHTLYRGVTNIDASKGKGDYELAGSKLADSIVGGAGNNSLWGGSGMQNDTLVGGTGNNIFYFGYGEGSDHVVSSKGTDKIVFYNEGILSTDVASAGLDGSNYVATLSDGSKLTIENIQAGMTASFADKTLTFDGSAFDGR